MKRLTIMIQMLETTESHLEQRVAQGSAFNRTMLQHDFIQLYRTRAKLTELRHQRGDELVYGQEAVAID